MIAKAAQKPWIVGSLREVAEFFGVAYQTAKIWSAEGMPRSASGFDLSELARWDKERAIARLKRDRNPQQSESVGDLDEQLKGEQIRKLKLANDLKEGRLVERDVVIQQASELCLRIKTRLESMPDEMEMTFPLETRVENKQDFGHRIWQVLKELAGWAIGEAS